MRLYPLIKHEFKNMPFVILVALMCVYFFGYIPIQNMIDSVIEDTAVTCIYGLNIYYGTFENSMELFGSGMLFGAMLALFQFVSSKKELMISLPYTRKELMISKTVPGVVIISAKYVILLVVLLVTYSKAAPVMENIVYYDPTVLMLDAGSMKNICMYVFTYFLLEIASYTFSFFCFSIGDDPKAGIGLIVFAYITFLLFVNWLDSMFYGHMPYITAHTLTEQYLYYIAFAVAVIIVTLLLSARYYMNCALEKYNAALPSVFARRLFNILLIINTGFISEMIFAPNADKDLPVCILTTVIGLFIGVVLVLILKKIERRRIK